MVEILKFWLEVEALISIVGIFASALLESCTLLPTTTEMKKSKRPLAHEFRCDRVDRVSLVLFPLMFFLVNVMYWSYYLLLNDIIAELW